MSSLWHIHAKINGVQLHWIVHNIRSFHLILFFSNIEVVRWVFYLLLYSCKCFCCVVDAMVLLELLDQAVFIKYRKTYILLNLTKHETLIKTFNYLTSPPLHVQNINLFHLKFTFLHNLVHEIKTLHNIWFLEITLFLKLRKQKAAFL